LRLVILIWHWRKTTKSKQIRDSQKKDSFASLLEGNPQPRRSDYYEIQAWL
jgi:hypothetical protein